MNHVERVCLAGLMCLLGAAMPAWGGNILFLGDLDGDANGDGAVPVNAAADQAMIARLVALGHTVTALDDSVATPADQAGKHLVIVSSTVGSGNAKTALVGALPNLQTVNLPIICMEPGLGDEMGLNVNTIYGYFQGQDNVTTLSIATPAHPIAAGVGGGLQTVFTTSSQAIRWYNAVALGPPYNIPASGAPGAISIGLASLLGPDDFAQIAEVPAGAMLGYGQLAPALRLGFFVGNGAFTNLTAAGLQLFDNAVGYAIPEPATVSLLGLAAAFMLRRKRA